MGVNHQQAPFYIISYVLFRLAGKCHFAALHKFVMKRVFLSFAHVSRVYVCVCVLYAVLTD